MGMRSCTRSCSAAPYASGWHAHARTRAQAHTRAAEPPCAHLVDSSRSDMAFSMSYFWSSVALCPLFVLAARLSSRTSASCSPSTPQVAPTRPPRHAPWRRCRTAAAAKVCEPQRRLHSLCVPCSEGKRRAASTRGGVCKPPEPHAPPRAGGHLCGSGAHGGAQVAGNRRGKRARGIES